MFPTNFTELFFFNEITQFLDITDIPFYRRVCKKSRNAKIVLSIDPSVFIKLQLKEIIKHNTEISNTCLKMKYNKLFRYSNLFNTVFSYFPDYTDKAIELNDEQKHKLIQSSNHHYICLQFSRINANFHNQVLYIILYFPSQYKVLEFLKKIKKACTDYHHSFPDFTKSINRDEYLEMFTVRYIVDNFSDNIFHKELFESGTYFSKKYNTIHLPTTIQSFR
jgi:hypothetical protein